MRSRPNTHSIVRLASLYADIHGNQQEVPPATELATASSLTAAQLEEAGPAAVVHADPLLLTGDLDFTIGRDSGLLRCLTCVASFSHPTVWEAGGRGTLAFAVALRSQLPLALPILALSVTFADATQNCRLQFPPGEELRRNEWRVLQFEIPIETTLRAAATGITLQVGPRASFTWPPESFGSGALGEAVVALEHPFPSSLRVQPGLAVVEPYHLRLPHT